MTRQQISIKVETPNGKTRVVEGTLVERDCGERAIITKRNAVYQFDSEKVWKIRPNSHSQTLIGYIA